MWNLLSSSCPPARLLWAALVLLSSGPALPAQEESAPKAAEAEKPAARTGFQLQESDDPAEPL